jgi:tetratricopeptide (TPR) repeat protein
VSRSRIEQKPGEPSEVDAATDAYTLGWYAINRLIRRGWSWSGYERNNAFLNLGNGTFVDDAVALGFDFPDDARALAVVDWDMDGAPDLFVTNRNTPRLRYLHAESGSGARTLALRLVQDAGELDAVGARVELEVKDSGADLAKRVQSVQAGSGYLAQSSAWLHFGLGPAGRPVRATVRWPRGGEETFAGFEGAGAYVLERGTGTARRFAPAAARAPVALLEAAPGSAPGLAPPRAPRGRRIVLASAVPMPRLAITASTGQPLELFGIKPGGAGTGTGRAILVNLWSSTCAPCRAELAEFAGRAGELQEADIAFLALAVDPDTAAARAVLDEVKWPFAWASASSTAIAVLDALQGALLDRDVQLPVPASFLVDAQGNWRALWIGRIDPDELFAARALLAFGCEEQRAAATPFPGRWLRPAGAFDPTYFEAKLRQRGLAAAADEFARAGIQVFATSPAKVLHGMGRDALAQGRVEDALQAFRRAVEADPRFFQAQFDLGFLYQQRGELPQAISAYRAALRLDPAHEEARFNLGLACLQSGDVASAERERASLAQRGSQLAAELARAIESVQAGTPPGGA